jgi:hypothetical protein
MPRLPGTAGWSGGGIGLARLSELTGVGASALPAGGARNLSGWIVGRLGRPVRGGDVVEGDGLRVAVRKVRRGRVLEAQVSRLPPAVCGSDRGPQPPPRVS